MPVDELVIDAVGRGYDVFASLQRNRIAAASTTGHMAIPLNVWSEEYRKRLFEQEEFRGNEIDILWSLVTRVIDIGVQMDQERRINASAVFREWFNENFVDLKAIEFMLSSLDDIPRDEPLENLTDLFNDILGHILQCFLAGLFGLAAQFIDKCLVLLRPTCGGTFLDEAAEHSLADVTRLLTSQFSVQDEGSYEMGKQIANRAVYDARIELNRDGEDYMHIAARLKKLCLNLLLIMTGDAGCIRDCHTQGVASVNVVTFVCGCVSAVHPFAALSEVHELFISNMENFDGGVWYYETIAHILGAEQSEYMVEVMAHLYARADEMQHERNRDVGSGLLRAADDSPGIDVQGDDNDAEYERNLFGLRFMAVHIADVCAPSFIGGAELSGDTKACTAYFERHTLLEKYLHTYLNDDRVRLTRIHYCAFSPLIDPLTIKEAIVSAEQWALSDRRMLRQLELLCQRCFDKDSTFQTCVQGCIRRKHSVDGTVTKWYQSFYEVTASALRSVQDAAIEQFLRAGRVVDAAWLALEIQSVACLQDYLLAALHVEDANSSKPVLEMGIGIHNGFVPVSLATTTLLLKELQACADLYDIRQFEIARPEDENIGFLVERCLNSAASLFKAHPTQVASPLRLSVYVRVLEVYMHCIEQALPEDGLSKVKHLLVLNNALAHADTGCEINALEPLDEGIQSRLQQLRLRVMHCLSHA